MMEPIATPPLSSDLKGRIIQVFQEWESALSKLPKCFLKELRSHGGTIVGKMKPIWPSVISNFTWKPLE